MTTIHQAVTVLATLVATSGSAFAATGCAGSSGSAGTGTGTIETFNCTFRAKAPWLSKNKYTSQVKGTGDFVCRRGKEWPYRVTVQVDLQGTTASGGWETRDQVTSSSVAPDEGSRESWSFSVSPAEVDCQPGSFRTRVSIEVGNARTETTGEAISASVKEPCAPADIRTPVVTTPAHTGSP